MQIGISFLVILIAFLLQNTVGIYIKLGSVTPDFVLIALLSISFIKDELASTSSGFFAGLLKDLISMRGFGVNTLTHTLIGYFAGAVEATAISSSLILIIAVAITTLASSLLYVAIAFLVSYQIDYLFWKGALIGTFYNALISPLVYLPINSFYLRLANKASGMEIVRDGQKKA